MYMKISSLTIILVSISLSACASYGDSAAYILNPKAPGNFVIESLDFYQSNVKMEESIGNRELQNCVEKLKTENGKPWSKRSGVKELYGCLKNKNISVIVLESGF